MKSKKLKKFIISLIAILTIFTVVNPPTNTYAQSGEGVDVCTWYYANGFSTFEECQNWLDFKVKSNTPAWKKQLDHCIAISAITTAASAVKSVLISSPAQAAATFGVSFISCMF